MSDEEEVMSEEEEEEETEEAPKPAPPAADAGPSEAELAMQRRRANQQISSEGLDETAKELLSHNAMERDAMAEEIEELRKRSEERKRQRAEEERALAIHRNEEDARRKQEEEERKRKKEQEEQERKERLRAQMEEFAALSGPGGKNFVIIKKSSELVGGSGGGGDEEEEEEEKYMSREQLEQERKAIMAQRITALDIDGFDCAKLTDKANSLFREILRLESEKYDLEKRFKAQQYDMMEMSERARQINQVGKTGLKRMALDETDFIAQKYTGAPGKIEMYSKFERQQDKRTYVEKYHVFKGPTYAPRIEPIEPQRKIQWDEYNPPVYTGMDGGPPPPPPEAVKKPDDAPAPEPEPAAAEVAE